VAHLEYPDTRNREMITVVDQGRCRTIDLVLEKIHQSQIQEIGVRGGLHEKNSKSRSTKHILIRPMFIVSGHVEGNLAPCACSCKWGFNRRTCGFVHGILVGNRRAILA
jgi:hypothetical protein